MSDEDLDGKAAGAAGVCHRLAEVSGRCTYDLLPNVEGACEKVSAPSFEAANRIGGLNLHEHASPEGRVQRAIFVLRAVEEDGIDASRRFFNVGKVHRTCRHYVLA